MTEKPYIIETVITKTEVWKYNPNYGDDRWCKCGHAYYRHFDTYEGMYACGCKYCPCSTFEEHPHTYKVVKKNKKLMVVDENGKVLYAPPDFLKPVNSRDDFYPILYDLYEHGKIRGYTLNVFETKFNPRLG